MRKDQIHKMKEEPVLLHNTTIDFYVLRGLLVNKIQIKKFSRTIPCLNRGKNVHQLEICFLHDEVSTELEKLQFSQKEIKNCVVFTGMCGFYGCRLLLKEKDLEIEIIIRDESNRFRKNIARRLVRCNSVTEFNSLFNEEEIIKGCGSVESRERAMFLQMYQNIVNDPNYWVEVSLAPQIVIPNFLRQHKCWASSCAGFSYLKCKRCMTARYCNVSCQIEDFEKHEPNCKVLAKYYEIESWASKRIQEIVKTHSNQSQKAQSLRSLSEFIKHQRWQCFRHFQEKSFKEELYRLLFCKLGFKQDSPIVDKIVTQKTYLTLLITKRAKKMRIKEAMAEVD